MGILLGSALGARLSRKVFGGGIDMVDFGRFFGILPLMKGSESISSRVGLFAGSSTKILRMMFLALSEMTTFSGKVKLPALIFL